MNRNKPISGAINPAGMAAVKRTTSAMAADGCVGSFELTQNAPFSTANKALLRTIDMQSCDYQFKCESRRTQMQRYYSSP